MGTIGGQASGDFNLSNSALRILYSFVKDTVSVLAADALTQDNPNVVTDVASVSTTLPANVKSGVLGGSVAFIRPDAGPNTVGGAVVTAGPTFTVNTRPIGIFINDAAGNAFENTPGVASGKGPFVRGGVIGTKVYETQAVSTNSGAAVGDPLTYSEGQFVYASQNGYLTNLWQDSYEFEYIDGNTGSGSASAAIEPDVTRMGVILSGPDANSTEMFVELFV